MFRNNYASNEHFFLISNFENNNCTKFFLFERKWIWWQFFKSKNSFRSSDSTLLLSKYVFFIFWNVFFLWYFCSNTCSLRTIWNFFQTFDWWKFAFWMILYFFTHSFVNCFFCFNFSTISKLLFINFHFCFVINFFEIFESRFSELLLLIMRISSNFNEILK